VTSIEDFRLHDTLCPKVWNEDKTIKEAVRIKLLRVAYDFNNYIGLSAEPFDIVMTGSLANFNYSDYSDVDLHLVFDFESEGWTDDGNAKIEIAELLKAKKTLWNLLHKVRILGFDVEVYAQDKDEPHVSSGVYSLLHNKWIVEPQYEEVDMEGIYAQAEAKAESFKEQIDLSMQVGCTPQVIEDFRQKIATMRKAGLSSVGELSPENIAFKILRRDGIIDLLAKAEQSIYDEDASLEVIEAIIGGFSDLYNDDKGHNVAIRAAAILDPKTGDIYTGDFHAHAQQRAVEAGLRSDPTTWQMGFVTNKGEFVTRQQALEIALRNKQVEKKTHHARMGLDSYDMPKVAATVKTDPYLNPELNNDDE